MSPLALIPLLLMSPLPVASDSAPEKGWMFVVSSGGSPLQAEYYVGGSERPAVRVGCESSPGLMRIEYSPVDPALPESRPLQFVVDGTVHPLAAVEGRSAGRLSLGPELVAALTAAREVVITGQEEMRFYGEAAAPFSEVAHACMAPRHRFGR